MDRVKQVDAIIGRDYLAVSGYGTEYAIIRIIDIQYNGFSDLKYKVVKDIRCLTISEGTTGTLACDVKLYDNWSESDIKAILI